LDKDRRIELAKLILENPLYIEKMAELEDGFIDQWKNTSVSDMEAREECWRLLKVKNMFETIISMCAIDETVKPDKPNMDYDTG